MIPFAIEKKPKKNKQSRIISESENLDIQARRWGKRDSYKSHGITLCLHIKRMEIEPDRSEGGKMEITLHLNYLEN